MNKPILKEMVQNEILSNPTFRKGRKYAKVLGIIYIVLRFSDPILSTILANIKFELDFQLLFGLLVSLWIGTAAIRGSVKLSGALFLLTPVGNVFMMLMAAKDYTGGFTEMMRIVPTAWYVLVMSVLCTIVGVWMLVDKNIAEFGRRRRVLQKEYVELLKAWGTAPATADAGKSTVESHEKDIISREPDDDVKVCQQSAAPAVSARPRHYLRNLIISLICCTVLALAAAVAMGILTPPTPFEELEKAQGGFVSLEPGNMDGDYRLKLDSSDLTYTISSIINFPAEKFLANQQPGAPLTLFYEDDEWRNILAISSDENTYMSYDQARQALIVNNYWGWGIVLVAYTILVVISLVIYFKRKKKAVDI